MRRGSYNKGHKPYKGHIPDRISIEERPEIINNSPYALDEFFKFCNSKKAAWLDFNKRRCLIAKWLAAVFIFRSSNLQNATREEKIWFAWESTRLVGEAAREAFCLIDLWYSSIYR